MRAAGRRAVSTLSGGNMAQNLVILHFNDVYNVEPRPSVEPVGGAARFCTAIKSFQHLSPMVLFSGDVFNPSMRRWNLRVAGGSFFEGWNFVVAVSTFTKGQQMVPVLNSIGVHCAVFGNHDFGKSFLVLT